MFFPLRRHLSRGRDRRCSPALPYPPPPRPWNRPPAAVAAAARDQAGAERLRRVEGCGLREARHAAEVHRPPCRWAAPPLNGAEKKRRHVLRRLVTQATEEPGRWRRGLGAGAGSRGADRGGEETRIDEEKRWDRRYSYFTWDAREVSGQQKDGTHQRTVNHLRG